MSASRIATSETSGQVEALAQQVHADEHVVLAEAQVADDLDAFERVDLRVQVARLEAHLEQVLRRGPRSSSSSASSPARARRARTRTRTSFIRSSIWFFVSRTSTTGSTIPVGRTICSTTRVERVRSYSPGRRRDEHQLRRDRQELLEGLRAVVQRARQPEAVVDERLLARAVALVHAADLRHRLVGLVDEADEVLAGSSRSGSRAARRARARRGSASSSRSPSRSRPRAASPCRTACAGAGGGTRAACLRTRAPRSARSARAPISSTAASIVPSLTL